MGLPAALVVAIEGLQGRSGRPVRVVSVRPSPLPPGKTKWLTITVETSHGRHAKARVAREALLNHEQVVGTIAEAMRRKSYYPTIPCVTDQPLARAV